MITIIGKQSACEAARDLLLKRVEELKNTIETKTTVDPTFIKALIQRRVREHYPECHHYLSICISVCV